MSQLVNMTDDGSPVRYIAFFLDEKGSHSVELDIWKPGFL